MNDPNPSSQPTVSQTEEKIAQRVIIRGQERAVVQLSRKIVIGSTCGVILLVLGAFYLGMQQRQAEQDEKKNLIGAEQKTKAEAINGLPKDYSELSRTTPRIGPPLPGDLGRPMLNAGVLPGTTIGTTAPVDPEVQRQNQEIEAARVSRLFATANVRQTAGAGTAAVPIVAPGITPAFSMGRPRSPGNGGPILGVVRESSL